MNPSNSRGLLVVDLIPNVVFRGKIEKKLEEKSPRLPVFGCQTEATYSAIVNRGRRLSTVSTLVYRNHKRAYMLVVASPPPPPIRALRAACYFGIRPP